MATGCAPLITMGAQRCGPQDWAHGRHVGQKCQPLTQSGHTSESQSSPLTFASETSTVSMADPPTQGNTGLHSPPLHEAHDAITALGLQNHDRGSAPEDPDVEGTQAFTKGARARPTQQAGSVHSLCPSWQKRDRHEESCCSSQHPKPTTNVHAGTLLWIEFGAVLFLENRLVSPK